MPSACWWWSTRPKRVCQWGLGRSYFLLEVLHHSLDKLSRSASLQLFVAGLAHVVLVLLKHRCNALPRT